MSEAPKVQSIRETMDATRFGWTHFRKYIQHPGIDIGYRGYKDSKPMYGFLGIDSGTPHYDGHKLPFADSTMSTVFSSHTLEHIDSPIETLREWFRVLKVNGHMILTVPHKYLYEKKQHLPSNWNADHKRFYTAANLLLEIEQALTPNTWRLIYCRDNDWNFDYSAGPSKHSDGCYEIECVVQKINPPDWNIE